MAKIKKVWVVAEATRDSTLGDILFEAFTGEVFSARRKGTSLWAYVLGTVRISPRELERLELHDSKTSALKEAQRRIRRAQG